MTDNSSDESAVFSVLEPAGSMTKPTLVEEVTDRYDYSEKEVKLTLLNLLQSGEIVEHPEIEGAYMPADRDID